MTCRDPRRLSGRAGAALVGALTVGMLASAPAFGGGGGVGSGGVGPQTGAPAPDSSTTGAGAFPIRGPHVYGDGLGAGRGHQGQDLMAKCGRPVVAAQAGRVQFKDSHSSAGNFVVIDGKGALADTVYMHLREPASVTKGQQVASGQVIGRVGDTGNTTACHLHFEMWGGAGWYEGGSPVDPRPHLRRWDRGR